MHVSDPTRLERFGAVSCTPPTLICPGATAPPNPSPKNASSVCQMRFFGGSGGAVAPGESG
eukprot:8566732-Alexandrium_andersonii.AAC.1